MEAGRNKDQIIVGISQGDYNGIGYEVILKTFSDKRMFEFSTNVLYGSQDITNFYLKNLNLPNYSLNMVKDTSRLPSNKLNIIAGHEKNLIVEFGKSTKKAGEMAFWSLEKAVDDLKNRKINVLVTAPINKDNIQSEKFRFAGHTDYLGKAFDVDKYLMLMVQQNLRIGVITGHIPLKDVAESISIELIFQKIKVLNRSLEYDFGIRKPKIALLGLNPHASDNSLIGKEEEEIIIPAIKKAQKEGLLIYGPFAADGFFASENYKNFDGILAMYHDQGLIPFKTLAFKDGVNFTAGLPVVRTSPAHGTAYEIAGKNIASSVSFRQAVYLGIEIFKNRKEYDEISRNPLPSALKKINQKMIKDEDASNLSDENNDKGGISFSSLA
ncbi:MAG: 4-hydroxythreonine-4-phosphate dehydrogenase PdxA [Bacteroidales bacterium]|jgi:4-hydroxythreonine-4-phosphate dehydrogenase|nr:4-hydroxythreonine-4-phosphate dehydrogenase PdxA [Bacteroidales bacterium]